MIWTLDNSISLTEFDVITDIKVTATGSSGVKDIPVVAPEVSNSTLSFVINSFSTKLTESTGDNLWSLNVYIKLNYSPNQELLATSSQFESRLNSRDISYKGTNVIYIDLSKFNWSELICVKLNNLKYSSAHVIDFRSMHEGVNKDKINEYVGNESNVNLHNQFI